MKTVDLYTYCVMGEEGKNKSVLIESDELKKWKVLYKKDLIERTYIDGSNQPLDVRRYYCDPDTTYKMKCNHHFFYSLVLFLKKMEKELCEKLQGNFNYEFVEDRGIKVCGTDKDGEKIEPFFLRSDQLGFSAPTNQKVHPYDLYIMQCNNKDLAIDQVIDWIANSRTIGGSFLWPTPFYCKYNPARGGKIISNRRYYIQDRVDLTLWEIKYWYEKTNKNTIMNRENKEDSNLNIWLEHFTDFETYVKFFHFEGFVQGNGKEMSPINILKRSVNEPVWGNNGENLKIEISNSLEVNEVGEMLSFVNNCILERTKTISYVIKEFELRGISY